MAVQWRVTDLTIETSTPNHVSDALFANGRMQVPVIISIRAIDPTTDNVYRLTDNELKLVQLVDYYDPDSLLPREWALTTTENEFSHVMPARLGDPEPPSTQATKKDNPAADTQKVKYWVTTTKLENVSIAVKIRQPNGTVIDTSGSTRGFDSHVTLTSVTPVHYTMSNIDVQKVEVARGKINRDNLPWVQYNYYITSKVYDFLKSDPHGYSSGNDDPGERYCYIWATRALWLQPSYMHYIWPMGPPEKRPVGLVKKDLSVDIAINQRNHAQVLTLFAISGNEGYFGKFWRYWSWFEIWDIYGNYGTFKQDWAPGYSEILICDYRRGMESEPDEGRVFHDSQPET